MTTQPQAGTGTATAAETQQQVFVVVDNFQPGQVVRVIFITPDQAKQLPAIPADALQIAIFPAGNS